MSQNATPEFREVGIVNVDFGKNVTVVKPVNLYGCKIGENSFIGPFVEIQDNVVIGHSCRIQSHSFICSGVTIGNDCFISHGAMFINDTFAAGTRAHGNRELWGTAVLGDKVLIGTNATIFPVNIVDRVVVGAGSVVTKDLTLPGIYVGSPARMVRRLD